MDKKLTKIIDGKKKLNLIKKMAYETSNSTFDYLNEECIRLIENNQINESNFKLLRLQKLFEKLRLRFGDDSENIIFQKLLRLSLKSMNYFLANYILDNFITKNMRPENDQIPDLLFLTMYWLKDQAKEFFENLILNQNSINNVIRNRSSFNYLNRTNHSLYNYSPTFSRKYCDFHSFDKVIEKLIPHSNINNFYISYGTSLLKMVIENTSSTDLNQTCKLTLKEKLFEICYKKIIDLEYLDVNVCYEYYLKEKNLDKFSKKNYNANQNSNKTRVNSKKMNDYMPNFKKVSIIQQAINDCKYDVAEKLVSKGSRIDNINIDDVIFVENTSNFFKKLYFGGYKFLPVNIFKLKYSQCIKDDECFNEFCSWLKKHQTRQLPLSCLCWNVLRNFLGHQTNQLLDFICNNIQLPEGFLKYARFQSLEILFKQT